MPKGLSPNGDCPIHRLRCPLPLMGQTPAGSVPPATTPGCPRDCPRMGASPINRLRCPLPLILRGQSLLLRRPDAQGTVPERGLSHPPPALPAAFNGTDPCWVSPSCYDARMPKGTGDCPINRLRCLPRTDPYGDSPHDTPSFARTSW